MRVKTEIKKELHPDLRKKEKQGEEKESSTGWWKVVRWESR